MVTIKNENKWYWNAVRGICIVLVIFIHVTNPLYDNGVVRWEWYFLRRITAFPVAVFFFMAGYFVHFDKIDSKHYLWLKVKRVFVPYLVFSTIYILLNILLGSVGNWKGFVANYIFGTAEIQMYYCIYLIQMILLLPILKKGMESKCRHVFLIFILLISVAGSWLRLNVSAFKTILNPICISFLIYYVLGLYVRGYTDGAYASNFLEIVKKKRLVKGIGGVFLAFAIAIFDGYKNYHSPQLGQITIGNYVYCISVVVLLLMIFWNFKGDKCPNYLKSLVWLGEQSFSIYLFHMILMRPMIYWFETNKVAYPIEQAILFFGTLFGCSIILLIKKRMIEYLS